MIVTRLLIAVMLCAAAVCGRAHADTAVEYYNAGWDQYFVTAFPDEIALLDAGAFGGVWRRTGETFPVANGGAAGVVGTCRFFGVAFAPRSAHFYTPFSSECEGLKSNPDWQFESIAFGVALADANGVCPGGTSPLYRLYNNGAGGAPNHRYTMHRATFDAMVARGWVPEGTGSGAVFACVPASGPSIEAAGVYTGMSSTGEAILVVVMPDGRYIIVHSRADGTLDRGVINGTATAAAGQLTSSDGIDYEVGAHVAPGVREQGMTLSGTYAPQSSLQVTLTPAISSGTQTITASYVPGSGEPASLDAASGRYAGVFGMITANRPSTRLFLDSTGHFTAVSDPAGDGEIACNMAGTFTPSATADAFDVQFTSTGGECVFGAPGDPMSGIAYYDPGIQKLRVFAPFWGRSNMLYMIVTKQPPLSGQ